MRRMLLALVVACGSPPSAISIAPAQPTPSAASTQTALPPPRPGSNVRVHIDGAKETNEADLVAAVEIDKPGKNVGASNRDVLERDALLVQAALYDRGYLRSQVAEPIIAIAADGVIDVTFRIVEGVRFRMTKLETEEKDERTGKLLTPLELPKRAKVGEWFNRGKLIQDLDAIRTTYHDAGYANLDVTPETVLDAQAQTVEVKIVIRRGPIVTFHAVRVDPPDAMVAADAAKRAGVTMGARYSDTNLMRIKSDLATKGIRAEIVTQAVGGKPDAVDVTIEVH
jgi:outer membrane protein insertion porin family